MSNTKQKKVASFWKKLFLFSCIFFTTIPVFSQNQTVRIKGKDITIKSAFEQIEKQTGLTIAYDASALNVNQQIKREVKATKLNDVLNEVLKGTESEFVFQNKHVVIRAKKNTPTKENTQPTITNSPKKTSNITGKVFDVKGELLIGVRVLEVGTGNGVITDENGIYNISLSTDNPVLQFTYIGFNDKKVPVGKMSIMDVVLEDKVSELEEVVVVGYGEQKRASVIGAISSIKPEVLQTSQSRSITNNLAGQIAGIIAVQRNGEPGYDDSDFWIRGINTFGANANPLVLIDGIERSISNISPEEIESFSVLKDATATAVYGVRGANGVILIQTKRGKVGKPRVTIKADYGVSNPTQLPKFVDAAKYMEISNEAMVLSGFAPTFTEDRIEKTKIGYDSDFYPNVNWLQAVTKPNAPIGRVSFDVNGGSENLRYSLVGSFFSEKGMIVRDPNQNYDSQLKLNKYTLRSNVDVDLSSSTRLALSIGGYLSDKNSPGWDVWEILWSAMDTPPNAQPIIYSDGSLARGVYARNIWEMATQSGYKKGMQSNLESSINLTQDFGKIWKPLEGLSGNILASFDAFNWHSQDRTKKPTTYHAIGRNDEGELIKVITEQGFDFMGYSRSSGGNRTLYFESRLNYLRYFNDAHRVEGLFLFNARDKVIQDAGNSILALPYRSTGIAGRAAYSFMDRYFTEFNFGYNGSENFKRGYRFGFFPSFALGWLVTNEPFMKPVNPVLSKLKLRGSWGLVGNDQIVNARRFAYISTLSHYGRGYAFGYTDNYDIGSSLREGDFGVYNMTWETAEKMDIGIEIGFINSINLSLDFFKEKRKDIFMQRKTVPELAGYNVMPYANFGKVNNMGFETDLIVNHQFNKDWFLTAKGNFTFARNKIIEYDEPEALKNTTRSHTGQPLNQYYGLIALGLYSEDDFEDSVNGILKEDVPIPKFGIVKPGDIKYKDINDDKVIDSFDESPIGAPYIPEIVYGFGFNTKYKNFDLGVFFQGTGNFSNILQGAKFIPGSGGGVIGNIYANVDDRWTPENPRQNVFWPRLSSTENKHNMRYSTWWLRDVSYLRLKNFELGYTIPKAWQKKVALNNARVFFRGSNFLTFSSFKMWDPEIGSSDGLTYPPQKIFTYGIEITL